MICENGEACGNCGVDCGGTCTPTNTETPSLTPTQTSTQTVTLTPSQTSTPAPASCPPTPVSGCDVPGKSKFNIKQSGGTTEKMMFKFGKGTTTRAQGDFGNPTGTTSYALCVYANGTLAAEANVPESPGLWQAISNGYKYKDTAGLADGIQKVLLKGGAAGKPKVIVKGKGGGLPEPMPALPLTTPVTVQVINNANSNCWADTYATANVTKTDSENFKAKKP
jgi:hypothetical protein